MINTRKFHTTVPRDPSIARQTRSVAVESGDQVRAAETAFAKSMADRNISAFAALIADEAVFFGGKGVSRGKAAVVADWKRFFDAPAAPFSWAPAEVEVLRSGTLGYSSGPVHDPQGRRIGRSTRLARQQDGSWKIGSTRDVHRESAARSRIFGGFTEQDPPYVLVRRSLGEGGRRPGLAL